MPKVWISKYALTTGIAEIEAEVCASISPNMISQTEPKPRYGNICYHRPFWHETREAAVIHAEKMRVAKVASLRKSVAKIEGIVF